MATLAENYKSQLAGPTVAGDIKSIKLNIAKLVTIQGGTPATKASSFFSQSKTKENAYESSFLKKKDTSPTQVSKSGNQTSQGGGFFDSIGSFFKSLLTGGLIAGAIAVIGKILEDEETRKSIKGLLVDVFESVFNGIKNIITLAGEALSDPKVIKSIIDVFVELGKQLFNVVKSIDQTLKDELGVPGGLLTVLAVGGTLYAAFGLLISALAGLTAAAGIAAAAWGAKVGGSIGPGKPGTTPAGTTPAGTKPGAPGTTPSGTAATTEKIAENKAKQVAAERGAMRAVATKGAAKQFAKIALAAVTGPILGSYLTAEFLYSIANLLSPSELAAVETHTKTLESIQDDIDEVIKDYNDGKITEDGYNTALQGLATKAKTVEQRLDALKKQIIKRMQEEGQDTSSVKKTFEDSEQRIAQRIAGDKSPTPVSQQASVRAIDNATIPSTSPSKVGNNYAERVGGRESGGNYDTIFGSKPGTVATINEKPVTENTIGEVIAWQQNEIKKKTNKQAAGKYQFMNVAEAARLAGLGPNELFNGPNQEKMMVSYTADNARQLRNEGLPDTEEYLSMAHAVGAKGARKLIDAQNAGMGDANSLDVLGLQGAAAKTNPQLNTTVDTTIASLKGGGSMGHGTMLAKNKSLSIDGKILPQKSEKELLADTLGDMLGRMAVLREQSNKTNQTPVSISSGGSSGGISSTYDNELIQTLIGLQSVST